jgi:uncharacterized phage protein (TIGR01671 family)
MEQREIKFRAFSTEKKQMHFGSDLYFIGPTCPMRLNPHHTEDFWECIDNTSGQYVIMQYTGLKDKNGVEVYEGDVIVFEIAGLIVRCEVVFYLGSFSVRREDSHLILDDLIDPTIGGFQVMGNVYESPELLQG